MARKAKKKARFSTPAWFEGIGVRAVWSLALAATGLGAAGWGVAVVHGRADEILAAEPVTIEMEWPVAEGSGETWLGESLRGQVLSMVEARLAGRALDAAALAGVGEMLTASGWFDGQPSVRRTGDGSIGITGVWRVPACVVRSGERDYVLDWEGRPLPIDYAAGTSGMRVILGVSARAPVSGGVLDVLEPWPGEDVTAALELLAPLLNEPFADQVAGIDVSGYFSLGQLAIVTDHDTRVVWGGRYGQFVPGEAESDKKLARLRAAAGNSLFDYRIDSGKNRIDISGERLIVDRTEGP